LQRLGIEQPHVKRPVIVTAAVTGSITTRADAEALPVSREEIIEAAVESWRAGAAIIHLHARDEDGTPTQDADIFKHLMEGIRGRGCEAIINVSTGTAGGHADDFEQRLAPLVHRPEMATLDCGSINFGDERILRGPYRFLQEAARRMKELNVIPEIEAFDTGMIESGIRLIEEGLIPAPGVWQICVGVRGGASGDLQSVSNLIARLPAGAEWSLLGVGRVQMSVNLISLAYGGHVRTGLEDNTFYRPGEKATSNAQFVERVVRLAEEIGRPIATPDEAREILGVGIDMQTERTAA
jgi:3-keto-5-aminohexanoate cleavage enzyme